VIGKGGATIRGLCEETGCQINIAEDGVITIASTDGAKAEFAIKRINEITAEVEIGKTYEGAVTKLFDFGALVNLLPGKDGLLHISQIAHERVEKVSDYLQEGPDRQGQGSGDRRKGPRQAVHEGLGWSVQKACLSVKSVATVVIAALVATVVLVVIAAIAVTVVIVVSVPHVRSSNRRMSRALRVDRSSSNNSSSDSHEEAGRRKLEDARQLVHPTPNCCRAFCCRRTCRQQRLALTWLCVRRLCSWLMWPLPPWQGQCHRLWFARCVLPKARCLHR
jgi:hypothetical protein